jgi:cell division protein FtsA
LASSDAVLTEDEKEIGVALVDIGGGTTDVAVFYDGIIRHTAVIPFGGNIVTQDIKQGCNILERYAEQLKVKYGSSLADKAQENKVVSIPGINGRPPKEISFKNLSHIIQSRMEEIIAQVYFEVEASGMLQQLGAGVVLTGGGALLKNLSQLVAFKTGMDVRLGLPNQSVQSKIVEEVNQPMFATAVGLMLTGISDNGACCVEENAARKNDTKITSDPEPQVIERGPIEELDGKQGKKKIASLFDNLGKFFEVDDEQM